MPDRPLLLCARQRSPGGGWHILLCTPGSSPVFVVRCEGEDGEALGERVVTAEAAREFYREAGARGRQWMDAREFSRRVSNG